ncbi:multidrug effflux MFS transporter [Lautropia mirabilis]|jgi:drug resistance transporter, bcr/cflA subfamily
MRDRLSPAAWLLILLAVVCLPRITIDIYLPSLPVIGRALQLSEFQLSLTMTVYMAGYAVSMLVCGPLADRYGRRPVLIGGTALYLVATIACALADSGGMLIAARLLQALGGCCGTVVGRVIVRDRFQEAEQVSYLSWMSSGMALSPVVAPLIGSVIDVALGWRWVFVVLAVVAAGVLLALCTVVPETQPGRYGPAHLAGEDDREHSVQPGLLRLYLSLLHDRHFLRHSLIISAIYCTYFPFVAESSLVLQRSLGLSQVQYAGVFALTILGYLGGASVFRRRFGAWGAEGVIGRALRLNLLFAVVWAAATLMFPGSLLAIVLPMMPIMLSVGMSIPACQFAVMQPHAGAVGAVSGLFFFIQMAVTALFGLVVATLSDGSPAPMVGVSLVASVLAWGAAWVFPARTDDTHHA